MSNKGDVESLLDALDEDRTLILRALADAHAEAGNEAAALAWRWLAENRKWPMQTATVWRWSVWEGNRENPANYELPIEVAILMCNDPEVCKQGITDQVEEVDYYSVRKAMLAVVGVFVSYFTEHGRHYAEPPSASNPDWSYGPLS